MHPVEVALHEEEMHSPAGAHEVMVVVGVEGAQEVLETMGTVVEEDLVEAELGHRERTRLGRSAVKTQMRNWKAQV